MSLNQPYLTNPRKIRHFNVFLLKLNTKPCAAFHKRVLKWFSERSPLNENWKSLWILFLSLHSFFMKEHTFLKTWKLMNRKRVGFSFQFDLLFEYCPRLSGSQKLRLFCSLENLSYFEVTTLNKVKAVFTVNLTFKKLTLFSDSHLWSGTTTSLRAQKTPLFDTKVRYTAIYY